MRQALVSGLGHGDYRVDQSRCHRWELRWARGSHLVGRAPFRARRTLAANASTRPDAPCM